jgi:hypothetical protein
MPSGIDDEVDELIGSTLLKAAVQIDEKNATKNSKTCREHKSYGMSDQTTEGKY